jgi:hypothetical protein
MLVDYYYTAIQPKLVHIILKHSDCISKKTQHYSSTNIGWLMLFKEIIPVRFEVFTALSMRLAFSWNLEPCSFIGRYKHFGET